MGASFLRGRSSVLRMSFPGVCAKSPGRLVKRAKRTRYEGRRPMAKLVRHAMTESPQTAKPDMNAADAAGLMRQLDVGMIPVARNGELIGLVTDRDLVLRVIAERKDPDDVMLEAIVTKQPVTVTPDTKLADALDTMREHKVRRLPVMKGQELVGIISLGDAAIATASD